MPNTVLAAHYILLAAISAAVVALQIVDSRRRVRLTFNMLALAAIMLSWQVCATVALIIPDEGAQMLLRNLCFAFCCLAAANALLFAIRFYSLDNYYNITTILMLHVMPLITVVLVAVQETHGFLRLPDGSFGPWGLVQEVYNLIMLGAAVAVALSQLRHMPRFYHTSTLLIVISMLATIAGSLVDILHVFDTQISFALISGSLCFILLYFSSRINHGLDYLNHARGEIYNELDEAIFITDVEGNVISRNLAARYMLFAAGVDVAEPDFAEISQRVFGGAASSVLSDNERDGVDYHIEEAEGVRVYNVRQKSITDNRGDTIGIMVICTDVTDDYATIHRIELYAGLDPMTGLLNRNRMDQIKQELENQARLPVAVFMCDIDNLKQVNDTLGHNQGDLIIRAAAEVLLSTCPPSAYIGRVGGDEFLILVPGMKEKQAQQLTQDLYRRIGAVRDEGVPIALSIGAAVREEEAQRWQEVENEADRRMYVEKRSTP